MKHAVVMSVLALALVGCSGEQPSVETVERAAPVGAVATAAPSAEPSPTPPVAVSADAAAKQYMEAFATDDAAKMAVMAELSEPGSAAHTYALHQRAYAEAYRAAGTPSEPQSVSIDAGDITLCSTVGDPNCGTFSNFQALANGKLTSFTVEGVAIESRLLPAGDRAPVSVGGVEVKIISAYQSAQTNNLIITAQVTNGSAGEVIVPTYDSDYVNAAGQQTKTIGQAGLTELQAGASTPVAIIFPATDPGGTLVLSILTSDFGDLGTLRLPIQ